MNKAYLEITMKVPVKDRAKAGAVALAGIWVIKPPSIIFSCGICSRLSPVSILSWTALVIFFVPYLAT